MVTRRGLGYVGLRQRRRFGSITPPRISTLDRARNQTQQWIVLTSCAQQWPPGRLSCHSTASKCDHGPHCAELPIPTWFRMVRCEVFSSSTSKVKRQDVNHWHHNLDRPVGAKTAQRRTNSKGHRPHPGLSEQPCARSCLPQHPYLRSERHCLWQ